MWLVTPVQNEAQLVKVEEKVNGETPPPPHLCIFEEDFYLDISSKKKIIKKSSVKHPYPYSE